MQESVKVHREAQRTLDRLLPRLERELAAVVDDEAWATFRRRLEEHFDDLFARLLELYGDRYDFLYHLERIVAEAAQSWLDRPAPLKELDRVREEDHAGSSPRRCWVASTMSIFSPATCKECAPKSPISRSWV